MLIYYINSLQFHCFNIVMYRFNNILRAVNQCESQEQCVSDSYMILTGPYIIANPNES